MSRAEQRRRRYPPLRRVSRRITARQGAGCDRQRTPDRCRPGPGRSGQESSRQSAGCCRQRALVDAVHADILASHAAQAAAVEHGTGGVAVLQAADLTADNRKRLFALQAHVPCRRPPWRGLRSVGRITPPAFWQSDSGRITQLTVGAEVDPWQSDSGRITQLTVGGERGVAARITSPGPGLGAASKLGDSARITLPRIQPLGGQQHRRLLGSQQHRRLLGSQQHRLPVGRVAQVVVTAVQCQVALVDAVHADILASHAAQA